MTSHGFNPWNGLVLTCLYAHRRPRSNSQRYCNSRESQMRGISPTFVHGIDISVLNSTNDIMYIFIYIVCNVHEHVLQRWMGPAEADDCSRTYQCNAHLQSHVRRDGHRQCICKCIWHNRRRCFCCHCCYPAPSHYHQPTNWQIVCCGGGRMRARPIHI